ncbi:PDGLE domain-containing protein [Janibacter melonis]|uniref:PDGLE domain-containing protein n=1 Tax=Janibacter melonis TaxID=262209 RepID=UPI0017805F32
MTRAAVQTQGTGRRVSTRTLVVVGLLVSLLLAGVVSGWASSHPDGLEHVASQVGFGDTAQESPTADSPMAEYETRGVEGRLGGALAGVVGVVLTAVLMSGLLLLLRRRREE